MALSNDSSETSIFVDFTNDINEVQKLCSNNKILEFILSKCPSTVEATKFISNESFQPEIFKKFQSLIALRIKINDEIKNVEPPRQYEFQNQKKFLLAFESTTKNQTIIFFKNEGSNEFFKLSLLDENVPNLVKSSAINFMIETLSEKDDKILFCSNYKFDLSTLINNSYINLLFDAVIKNDLKYVQEVIKIPIDVNGKIRNKENNKTVQYLAIDIAWRRKKYEIVYELLNANSMFPKDFKEEEATSKSSNIEKFLEISREMIDAVKSNNLEKVKEILKKQPHLRYFFNKLNTSVIRLAVRNFAFDIYQTLCIHNVTYGPDEPFKEICEMSFKEKIHEYNSSMAQLLPEYHIMVLLSKSVLSQCDKEYHERLNSIRNAFESLNSLPGLKPVLQLLAFDRKTKFFFDFTQTSIVYMNPTLREMTKAVFIPNKHHIQIAAKYLLEDYTKHDALASLAHECYHSVFNLVFMNERLPYAKGDVKNEEIFKKLTQECEKLQLLDPIIKAVYQNYKNDAWERELAVRAPHMIVFYQNDPKKLESLKKTFKNLFDYHEKNVMPEIEETVKFYEKFVDESNEINFADLTKSHKAAICHSNIEFQGIELKINEIFEDQILTKLSPKQIRKILDGRKLSIGKSLILEKNFYYKEKKFINIEFKGQILDFNEESQKYELSKLAKDATKNIDEILTEVALSRIFILPELAGAGKSTTIKFLALKIKEKKPRNWVSIIDLKRHLKIYEKHKDFFNQENPEEEIEEKIFEILIEILSISDEFEILFFKNLLLTDRVVLLFDGVDEIAPKYEKFFIKLMKNIKISTKIQQWVTTRTQHETKTKETLEHEIAYKFVSFDSDEVEEFVAKYMKFKNFTGDLNLIKKVVENLKIFENVLMLSMVVDLQIAGRLPTENFNQYSLYEAMIEMKNDIVAEKGSLVNRDGYIVSKMTLWEIHQIYAFKLLFEDEKFENVYIQEFFKSQIDRNEDGRKFKNFKDFQLFKKWQREKPKWSSNAISRCGFLTILDWNSDNEFPEFNHRTYAEFFVAKFIVEEISDAIEHDDELSQSEFENRMQFAIFIMKEYFMKSASLSTVHNFITDFLSHQRPNLNLCDKFYKFLEKQETKNFIKNLNNGFGEIGFDMYNFYKFISKFNEISNSNSKILKLFTFIENGQSELFKCSLNELYDCFSLCAFMFNTFKNSNLENWHKLTGLGLNLSKNSIKLPTKEEFENLTQEFLTSKEIFGNENKRIKENVIWSEEEKLEILKQFYQFFCFLANVDDTNSSIIQRLLNYFSDEFSVWILRSKRLTMKFFEISEKYFRDDKASLAKSFNSITNFTILTLRDHHFLKCGPKFIECFENYYENIENFFQFNRELMQIVLCEHRLLCFVILRKMPKIIQMYKKYQDQNEKFFDCLVNAFFIFSTMGCDEVTALTKFNEFSAEISEFSNIFQFFFNSAGLENILGFVDAFRKKFEDWYIKTEYNVDFLSVEYFLMPTQTALETVASELYPIDYSRKDYQKISSQSKLRFYFVDFFLLLSFIETFEIPKNHVETFNRNNSEKCFEFAFKFYEILNTNSFEISNKYIFDKCLKICKTYLTSDATI